MRIVDSIRFSSKKIFCISAGIACGAALQTPLNAQTTNWTGDNGDVWERGGSWQSGQPSTSSIAVIEDGPGTSIALRDGSVGTVSVGTLLLQNARNTHGAHGAGQTPCLRVFFILG